MNKLTDLEDVPFVNEECGDTMWDEAMLDQLTASTANQQLFSLAKPVLQFELQTSDVKASTSKQTSQNQV